MNRKGFVSFTIFLIIALFLVLGTGAAYLVAKNVSPPAVPVACTQEAKLCLDGSAVGRTGPHCEFAECPISPAPSSTIQNPTSTSKLGCTSDSDCPSSKYYCEALEGRGVAYPNTSTPSAFIITKGICKLKESGACNSDFQCASGLLCHAGVCTNPIGQKCSGSSDASCPSGYRCIQGCGPPVVREGEPPPPYVCELNEYAVKPRMCPICLASNSNISTPDGNISVRDMQIGTRVWSLNKDGIKIVTRVVRVSRTPVLDTHKVIHLVLADAREVWASPEHPTVGSGVVGNLKRGDLYDGSKVVSAELVPYWDRYTYDLLPDSDTGYYFANGILLGSTLK